MNVQLFKGQQAAIDAAFTAKLPTFTYPAFTLIDPVTTPITGGNDTPAAGQSLALVRAAGVIDPVFLQISQVADSELYIYTRGDMYNPNSLFDQIVGVLVYYATNNRVAGDFVLITFENEIVA